MSKYFAIFIPIFTIVIMTILSSVMVNKEQRDGDKKVKLLALGSGMVILLLGIGVFLLVTRG